MPKLIAGTLCAKKREYLHAGEQVFHRIATASICAWALESLHGLCMSKHFNLMEFVRLAPRELLQAYCGRYGLLTGFDWTKGRLLDPASVATALSESGSAEFTKITSSFKTIWDMMGPTFTRGLLNEARFHQDQAAYDAIQRYRSHLGKAFWATLEAPQHITNAKILSEVEKLPAGAWIRRTQLPARPGSVTQELVERLEAALIEFFLDRQYRGASCKIDCLRQGPIEIFFAYAEDHPDADLFWEAGELKPQVLSPSFKLIFRHDDERRTLDIHIEGDRRIVPDLQQIFASIVLGEEIPRDQTGTSHVYDIDRVLQPGFQFEFSDELGIIDAQVTKLRFVLRGEPWARIMLEAESIKDRTALPTLAARLLPQLPKSRLELDQVCIGVHFAKREIDRKSLSRSFFITKPNSLRLKMDDLGEKIVKMLVQSNIDRSGSADNP